MRQKPVGEPAATVPLAKLVKTALDDIRMLVIGAQILLGFELSGVFRDGFQTLPQHARYLDAAALLLMVLTIALLVTPQSYHQIVDIGGDTGEFHQLISRVAPGALLPFACSLRIALFIAGEHIFGFALGLAAGCIFTTLTVGCWYAFQYIRRLHPGLEEVHRVGSRFITGATVPLAIRNTSLGH
jgi:hypothetical protein